MLQGRMFANHQPVTRNMIAFLRGNIAIPKLVSIPQLLQKPKQFRMLQIGKNQKTTMEKAYWMLSILRRRKIIIVLRKARNFDSRHALPNEIMKNTLFSLMPYESLFTYIH